MKTRTELKIVPVPPREFDPGVEILYRQAIRARLSWDLVDDRESPDPCLRFAEILDSYAASLREIASHEHVWDDDSRCMICGADGLA